MTETNWARTVVIVTVTLMLITSLFVGGVGVAAAKTGSIQQINITNTTDRNQDDQFSDFNLRVTADTTLKGWDIFSPGNPRFVIKARGKIDGTDRTVTIKRTETVSRKSRGTFPIHLKRSELQRFDSGNIRITVTLLDHDTAGTDKVDTLVKTVGYETKQDDQKKLKQTINRITGLTSVYKNEYDKRLNIDYWVKHQQDHVFASLEAIFPKNAQDVVTGQFKSTLEDYLSVGFVDDLFTVPEVAAHVGRSLSASKRIATLRTASQPSDDYNDLRSSLKKLRENTNTIKSADSQADKNSALEKRSELLKNAYMKEQKFRANLKESYDDDQYYEPKIITILYGSDKNSFKLVKADLIKLEQTLKVDYVATRSYNSPNRVKKTLAEATDFKKPTYPKPEITDISAPKKVDAGKPVTIKVTVKNTGSDAPYQTIALGLPDSTDAKQVRIVDQGLPGADYAKVFDTGTRVGSQYGTNHAETNYPLVEIGGSWKGGESHTVKLRVTPQKTGEFRIYAKSVAKDGGWNSDPTIAQHDKEGIVLDQQNELAYEHHINVVPQAPENKPPIAHATVSSEAVESGQTVTLDAQSSEDPDGSHSDLKYSWSIAEAPPGANPSLPEGAKGRIHLSKPGQYEFKVTVSDGEDSTSSTVTAKVTEKTTTQPPTTTTTNKPTTIRPPTTTTTTEPSPPDTTTTTTETTTTSPPPTTTTTTDARNQNKNVKPRVEMRDYTGDGTQDIRIWNGKTWAQFNGEDLDSRSYISSLGRNGTDSLAGPWQFKPTTRDATKMQFQSTKSFEVAVNSDDLVGYQVVRRYTLDGIPFRATYTVYLPKDASSTIVRAKWTNLGSQKVVLDQKPSHIHDGIMVMKGVKLAHPSGSYRFYVRGGGTHAFSDVGTWQTFPVSGNPPYVSVFDDKNAITYALLNGSTNVREAVTNHRPPRLVDFMVQALSLDPQETGRYTLAVGAHKGGPSSPQIAKRQLEDAITHQDQLPDQSKKSTVNDNQSGITEGNDSRSNSAGRNHLKVTKDENGIPDGKFDYRFSVTGELELGDTATDKTKVDSNTVDAIVGPERGTADYYFTGHITNFNFEGDPNAVAVYLNGDQVDPSTLGEENNSSDNSKSSNGQPGSIPTSGGQPGSTPSDDGNNSDSVHKLIRSIQNLIDRINKVLTDIEHTLKIITGTIDRINRFLSSLFG